MILAENKNTIHFNHRLLLNCLLHDLEIVTVNGGDSTSQYHTQLTVAKFTGNQKKIKSGYFITTPHVPQFLTSKCMGADFIHFMLINYPLHLIIDNKQTPHCYHKQNVDALEVSINVPTTTETAFQLLKWNTEDCDHH
jgi:hypothetical protein